MAVKTIEWRADTVRMIDQRLLPARETIRIYKDYRGVGEAIRTMVIRGAPAIGVAAAMGVALGIISEEAQNLILAGALLSITLNPLVFLIVSKIHSPKRAV